MTGNRFSGSHNDPMSGLKDSLEKINAMQANHLFEPMKRASEALDAARAAQFADLKRPMSGLKDSLEKISAMQANHLFEPMKRASEALDAARAAQFADLKGPMSGLKDSLEKISAMQANHLFEPMILASEALDAARAAQFADLKGPMSGLKDSLEKISAIQANHLFEPMKRLSEALDAARAAQFADLKGPMSGLKDSLEKVGAIRIDSILDRISKEKWPLAYNASADDITISSDSTITVDSTTFTYEEIQDFANQIVDKVNAELSSNLEQGIAQIVSVIQAVRIPGLEKLLTWLVFPMIVGFLLSFVNPIADFYVKEHLAPKKKEIEKQLRNHVARSIGNTEQLNSFRFISANILNVRSRPSNKAQILGRLQFAQVVVLIKRDKDWSLVAWTDDENGLQLQGWVFSRYLQKFREPLSNSV